MNLNRFLDRFRSRAEQNKEPIHSEIIQPSSREQWEYAEWLQSGAEKEWQKIILEAYHLRLNEQDHPINLYLHNQPGSKGLLLHFPQGVSLREARFVHRWLRDTILNALEYHESTSRRMYEDLPKAVRLSDRYYLKPGKSFEYKVPVNQLYGNVLIEMVCMDDVPNYLKLFVTYYEDRNYLQPLQFSDLVKLLFNQ